MLIVPNKMIRFCCVALLGGNKKHHARKKTPLMIGCSQWLSRINSNVHDCGAARRSLDILFVSFLPHVLNTIQDLG